jgi:ketosteroid isomerase-like protein
VDDREMKAKIESLYESGDMEALARAQEEMVADDYVQDWPQSGERIRGRENAAAVNRNYPTGAGTGQPKITLRRVLAPGEAWIIEATIDYGNGVPVSAVSILETRDGKIAHQTDYFANPFEAPEWRRQWVDRLEPASAR